MHHIISTPHCNGAETNCTYPRTGTKRITQCSTAEGPAITSLHHTMALQIIIPSKTGTNKSATLCAGICCRGGGGRRARQGAAGKPAAGWAQRGGVCAGGCGPSARGGPGAGSVSAALLRRAAPAALPLLLARPGLPGALLELYCHSSSLVPLGNTQPACTLFMVEGRLLCKQ